MCALPSNQGKSTRHRRCKECGHLNAPSYLVCQKCSHVLSGSDWVDVPPQTNFSQVDEMRNVLLDREADIQQRQNAETGYAEEDPYATRLDPMPGLSPSDAPTQGAKRNKPKTRKGNKVSAVLVDATQQLIKLSEVNLMETRRVSMPSGLIDDFGENISTIGTSIFDPSMVLCLDIGEDETPPVVLRLPQKRNIIIGRKDPKAGQNPDIDLIPYGAYQCGISRRHAALELVGKRLRIFDMDSSNGTFLNGDLLEPNEPHQLRDGDVVHLGKLRVKVTFRR